MVRIIGRQLSDLWFALNESFKYDEPTEDCVEIASRVYYQDTNDYVLGIAFRIKINKDEKLSDNYVFSFAVTIQHEFDTPVKLDTLEYATLRQECYIRTKETASNILNLITTQSVADYFAKVIHNYEDNLRANVHVDERVCGEPDTRVADDATESL